MAVKISAHALTRAAERGITEEGIRAILAVRPMQMIESETDPDAGIVLGEYEDKVWAVIFNYNTLNVITVRRAREYERIIYEQKKGNRPNIL
jgi:uncharacterized DUF497 family protein